MPPSCCRNPALIALMLLTSSCLEPACPLDERIYYFGDNRAELCAMNMRTLVVHFHESPPPSVETVERTIEPIGAQIVCDDPESEALPGERWEGCYFIRLPPDMCCGEGIRYLGNLDQLRASADVMDPDNPCDCRTHWDEL